MKKLAISIIMGLVLSFSISTNAAEIKMIGKKVQGTYPVKIDGVKLELPAIVIDGVSYIPVKLAGQTFGYDVKFDSKEGIGLKTSVKFQEIRILEEDINDKKIALGEKKIAMQDQQKYIDDLKKQQSEEPDDDKKKDIQGHINFQEAVLKSDVEAMPILEQVVAELEAQKAALEN